jgi:hypothetical protein
MYGSPITKEYLQGLAQAATSDFLSRGTPLTEAVIKQASACGANLTAEHVRRICEMTYHDTYERMHKQASSADRYIVFDPPDAEVAAEVLRAEKVASAPKRATSLSGGVMTEKTASASAPRLPKFKAANAFDELMKSASDTDYSAPFAQAQGLHDLKKIHDSLKEASAAVTAELRSLDTEIMSARRELSKEAYAAVKDGVSVEDVLHACFEGTDWSSTSQETATKVASDLSAYLLGKERTTVGLRLTKTASFGEVSPSHPLPASFSKVAAVEERHIHLEIALRDIQADLEYANRALTESLFGDKLASVAGLARSVQAAGKKALQYSETEPLKAGLYAGGAAGAVGLGAYAYRKKFRQGRNQASSAQERK